MTLKAIAIQNYGSSGTTFVHSLLDNHPQVLQLPGLRGGEFYDVWRRWVTSSKSALTAGHLRTLVLDYFSPLSDPEHIGDGWGLRELGAHRDQHPCVPRNTFVALFDRYLARFSEEFGISPRFRTEELALYRKAHLCAVYHSFEAGLGHDMSAKRYIVYPIHSAVKQDLVDLLEDFAQAFILHMIRNPINNLNSVSKYYLRARTLDDPTHDIFSSGLHAMFLDRALNISPARVKERLYGLYYYDDSVRSISRAVRLEDLHRNPETVMRGIARWAGLRWDPVLLESTFGGLRWWNRPGLSRVSGFSPGLVSKEIEAHTTRFDEERLKLIGQPIIAMYYRDSDHDRRRGWRLALNAIGCLLPFSVERSWRSPLRARIIFARLLKRVAPSYGAAMEEDAFREFEQRKAAFDPSCHVLMPASSAMQTTSLHAGGAGGAVEMLARCYCSLVDYVRHRVTIVRAMRFVRANKLRQVAPLLDTVPVEQNRPGSC